MYNTSMIPVYQKIIETLKDQINSGIWAEGAKLPSESQLMAEFNTSRITVTRALKELELTGVIYREKGRGSFVASKESRNSKVISLIIPHKADFFSGGQQYVRSVYNYCQQCGYLCSVHYSEQSSKKERAILSDVLNHRVSGIILYPISNKNIDIISNIMITGSPIVLLDRKLEEVDIPVIESDNYEGALDAVNYLLNMGHTRIAFVGAKESRTVGERYRGYCSALISAGIPIDRDLVFTHYDNIHSDDQQEILTPEEASSVIERLVSLEDTVTAVFCANDIIAVRLIKAAEKKGLKVPEDISFVGFDNISYISDDDLVLTSVEQDFDQIGKSSVDLLCRKINSGVVEGGSVVVPTRLNIGTSVADLRKK